MFLGAAVKAAGSLRQSTASGESLAHAGRGWKAVGRDSRTRRALAATKDQKKNYKEK